MLYLGKEKRKEEGVVTEVEYVGAFIMMKV